MILVYAAKDAEGLRGRFPDEMVDHMLTEMDEFEETFGVNAGELVWEGGFSVVIETAEDFSAEIRAGDGTEEGTRVLAPASTWTKDWEESPEDCGERWMSAIVVLDNGTCCSFYLPTGEPWTPGAARTAHQV